MGGRARVLWLTVMVWSWRNFYFWGKVYIEGEDGGGNGGNNDRSNRGKWSVT